MAEFEEKTLLGMQKDIIEKHISTYLELKDLKNLILTSRSVKTLFQKPLVERKVATLLQHVAFGEQDQAEAILKKDPNLLLKHSEVIDYSHRKFKDITAFQYALWAFDRDMWEMLLKYLPMNEAKKQLEEHELKAYHDHGMYYNFEPLKNALKNYADNIYVWADTQYNNVWSDDCYNKYWCQKVGTAQRLVPAWLASLYCHPEQPFYPLPNFKKMNQVPRTMKFLNSSTKQQESWYPLKENTGLGVDYAILREGANEAISCQGNAVCLTAGSAATNELAAITILCEVRRSELLTLKEFLSNQASPISNMQRNCTLI